MSATFGRLLAVAYQLGGGLIKLGGDALLLFFDGNAHAARACAAAWGMRDSPPCSARSRPRSGRSS